MNNSISSTNIQTLKPADATSTTAEKSPLDSVNTEEKPISPNSFKQSIKKAFDQSKTTNETNDAKQQLDSETEMATESGNSLPLSVEGIDIDITAKTDVSTDTEPLTLPAGLYLTEQLPTDEKPLNMDDININPSLTIDAEQTDTQTNINANATVSISSSETVAVVADIVKKVVTNGKLDTEPSTLLASEPSSLINKLVKNSTGGTNSRSEMTTLATEMDALKTEVTITGTNEKTSLLTNSAGQQSVLSGIQASLLQQGTTKLVNDALADKSNESLAQINSSPVSNLLTNNVQTTSTPPPVQLAITESFAKPAWQQAMGKQIMMMVNQNISTAEIRLNPSNLGPIEILIDMREEQVAVSMTSRHAIVREAMEQALPKLREMLDQNGFSLADSDISKHSFSEQREQNAKNNNNELAASSIDQANMTMIGDQVLKQIAGSDSMVDYYI